MLKHTIRDKKSFYVEYKAATMLTDNIKHPGFTIVLKFLITNIFLKFLKSIH